MIEPVKRPNVGDMIINQIKELIVLGKLKPGDKLPPERELMERFQVGRTSLREALKVLGSQGLIERSQKGTIISNHYHEFFTDSLIYQLSLTDADWADIFESRRIIEKELTYLAAQRATEKDLAVMCKSIEGMKKAIEAEDQEEYVSTNMLFHETIAKASKNLVMVDLYLSISNLVLRVQTKTVVVPGVMDESLRFHQSIYNAIKKREAEKASVLMIGHLDSVHGFLKKK